MYITILCLVGITAIVFYLVKTRKGPSLQEMPYPAALGTLINTLPKITMQKAARNDQDPAVTFVGLACATFAKMTKTEPILVAQTILNKTALCASLYAKYEENLIVYNKSADEVLDMLDYNDFIHILEGLVKSWKK